MGTAPAQTRLVSGEELFEREKPEEYFALGVHRVWVVEPGTRSVLIYQDPTALRQLKEGSF